MEDMCTLQNQVALVTGGGSGIGFGITEQLITLGARVVITGRSAAKLEEAREKLGNQCFHYVQDVTERGRHHELLSWVEKKVGALSILVNNAGIHCKKPSLEITDLEFDQVLSTNLHAVFALTREAMQYMIPRRKGSVISISSMTALYGMPQVVAYGSSKTALLGMTRALATEYSDSGVRFNTVAPGFIESKMFNDIMKKDPARKKRILERTPAGRFGTPADVGRAVAFLASDAAAFITGICLPVDGGNSIGF